MKIIDPTYLRTIYDGLNSGAIHKDNASALPAGLVGMYEAAFPPTSNVNNRKKVLDFFAVWSLLRREVSAAFVLPLLEGWTEEQLLEYIIQYSKWFNSPVSGKYQLYHERFRAFILQKISHQQFSKCNDLIINQCQRALLEKNGNEWEYYALEHLSKHLLIKAIENGDGSALKSLSHNTSHWNRQVEISKGFEWSKRMLNDMMLWAYKYNEEEVIECALNKVDLHHLEQNDAPRIVELVAQNDIETAIQRLESFGGNDNEGLQRKFILYMLCFIELTLLESKDKSFKKEAIEKLLKHFDENIPVDHSVLNWNDFFPSYLVFLISVEIKKIDLDYSELYKRTEIWDSDWIKDIISISEFEIETFLKAIHAIKNEYTKSITLINIAVKLYSISNENFAYIILKQALKIAENENDDDLFDRISFVHISQGNCDLALLIIENIKDEFKKSLAYNELYKMLKKQSKDEEAEQSIKMAINYANIIDYDYDRCIVLNKIANLLGENGNKKKSFMLLEQSANIADGIDNLFGGRDVILNQISNIKQEIENIEKATKTGVNWLDYINDELKTENNAVTYISESTDITRNLLNGNIQLSFQKIIAKLKVDFDDSLMIGDIQNPFDNRIELILDNILSKMLKLGNFKYSRQIASYGFFQSENDRKIKISEIFLAQGAYNKAIEVINEIDNEYSRCIAFINISIYFQSKGNKNATLETINKAIQIAKNENDDGLLYRISFVLISQENCDLALLLVENIKGEYKKSLIYNELFNMLKKQGKGVQAEQSIKMAINYANIIDYDYDRCIVLNKIANLLGENGNKKKSFLLLEQSANIADGIDNLYGGRDVILNQISINLMKIGDLNSAIKIKDKLSTEYNRINGLKELCVNLAKKGNVKMAVELSSGINNNFLKANALIEIVKTVYNDKIVIDKLLQLAFENIIDVADDLTKCFTINDISNEYFYKGNFVQSNSTIHLAYKFATKINKSNKRIEFWKKLGRENYLEKSMAFCITQLKTLPNDEAVFFYKRGMTEAITATNANASNVLELLELVKEDTKSIAHLLQMHALYLCFFEKTNPIKIQRLNKTLNIQWAIDLKEKLN